VRILGIDPGYGIMGWSIVEKSQKLINFGVIETDKNLSIEERLKIIYDSLNKIIALYQPDKAAMEKIFYSKNQKTVINVAKTIGIIQLLLKQNNIEFEEYTPNQVKLAITGSGSAGKSQIQFMVKRIFNLKSIPEPDDAADAVAIALCHSFK
jgi:crossover junction endodeoxyribonuclease RuvC